MKKHGYLVIGALAFLLVGCTNPFSKANKNSDQPTQVVAKEFSGLKLDAKTVTYDGQEHELTVIGELPEGTKVDYGEKGNKFKDVGNYRVTAIISCSGYKTLTLTAVLSIIPADFAGISLQDQTITFDGQPHSLTVKGTLPAGATVSYGKGGNTFTLPGVHTVKAKVECAGYHTAELEAKLTIVEAEFQGLTMENSTVQYDGLPHKIEVQGDLPEGATVSYGKKGNTFTEVGEYAITAVIKARGYVDLTLNAILTITQGSPIEGVSLENANVEYDGQKHTIGLTGELPEGATFSYVEGYDGGTLPGTYTVKGIVEKHGYPTLNLEATLVIYTSYAQQALNIYDFEGMDSSDIASDWTLQYYNNGWVTPSGAAIKLGKNQVIGTGESTMRMELTHQGQAFKVTRELEDIATKKRYASIAIDTFADNNASGSKTKMQVQLWFKDLPLPEAYSGYKDTYITYTLANEVPSNWTHWEIPLDDPSISIASGSIPAEALAQLGLTVDEMMPFVDKIAVLATPNYLDGGPKDYVYFDNIKLLGEKSERTEQQVVNFLNREYAIVSNDGTVFDLAIDEEGQAVFQTTNLETNMVLEGEIAINSLDGSMMTLTCTNGLIFQFVATRNGTIMNYATDPTGNTAALAPIAEHIDFEGHLFNEVIALDTFDQYEATGQGYDRGHTDITAVTGLRAKYYGEVYNPDKPAPGLIDDKWNLINDSNWQDYIKLEDSGVHGKAMSLKNNADWQTRYMTLDLAKGGAIPVGRGQKLSFFVKGSVAQTIKFKAYYDDRITTQNQGDESSTCACLAGIAVGTDWTRVEIPLTANREVFGIDIIPTKANGRIFIDEIKMYGEANPYAEYVAPVPVTANEITDGKFSAVIGGVAYTLDVQSNVTAAVFGEVGGDTNAFTAEMANSKLTLKDTVAAGAGLTVVLDIDENGVLEVSEVTGALASQYSAFVGTKLYKGENVALDFQNTGWTLDQTIPLTGTGFTQYKWNGSAYTELSSSQMRLKSSSTNKFINMYSGYNTAYKYTYTPAAGSLGPVNHLYFKYANNFNASTLNVRVFLTKMDGTDVYLWGDASGGFHTVAANEGDRNGTWAEFDEDVTLGIYKSVTIIVKSALDSAYLYIDDLTVGYVESTPTPPEPPVETHTITGGDFYLWNGSSDAYRMTVNSALSEATLSKLGASSFDFNVTISGETVTMKDKISGGSGITAVGTISADEQIHVDSLSGSYASMFSGSLVNKTFKKCADASVNFDDGAGSGSYSNSHWTEQKYTTSWVDVANPEMNSRLDAHNNKVANLVCDSYTKNFIYTPDLPMGPVNHVSIFMGNYFASSAGNISVKVAIIDGSGNKTYFLGNSTDFYTVNKDTSGGNVTVQYAGFINLCVGYKIQITTKCSAGNSYLYLSSIDVGYVEH